MKSTDYSKIAGKYDNNDYRNKIDLDIELMRIINDNRGEFINALDLSCGTGIYLAKQIEYFKEFNVHWHALDASKDMLDVAKSKIKDANFYHRVAEDLIFDSKYFHYISNNYAFHHYSDKGKALDEIYRVLRTKGVYRMHNISINDMRQWWIYKLFPSAYEEDNKRFWDKEYIYDELTRRGFDVKLTMDYKKECTKVTDFMDYVRNKDISVLTLISENDYRTGVEKLEHMIRLDKDATIVNDFAIVNFIAVRK